MDYREQLPSPSAEREDGLDKSRLLSPWERTTIDPSIGRTDSSSPALARGRGSEGGGRGGRGGGGLAHERTKSRRRQVAAAGLLDDRGSATLSLVQPYWLPTRSPRPRYTERSSTLVDRIKPERGHHVGDTTVSFPGTTGATIGAGGGDSTSSSLEDSSVGENYWDENYSTTTATTKTTTTTTKRRRLTTVPVPWTTAPYRLIHRTVPWDDDSENSDRSAGRRDTKAKDEERGKIGTPSRKDGARFVFGGGGGSGEVKGGGGGVVEWTTTVARPMSAWSYPEDEESGAGSVRTRPSPEEAAASEDEEAESGEEQVKVTVAHPKGSTSSTSTTARTTLPTTTTQLPPPSQDTSMEAREYHHPM